jgi:hypothetical protein
MNRYDDIQGYCRKLGHYLTFQYCHSERGGLPCPKIRDCWFERLPIEKYLEENFNSEQIQDLQNSPPPKMLSLVEMIERAKRVTRGSD